MKLMTANMSPARCTAAAAACMLGGMAGLTTAFTGRKCPYHDVHSTSECKAAVRFDLHRTTLAVTAVFFESNATLSSCQTPRINRRRCF